LLKLPMFSKALKTEVIDGKVYVDLDQLVQLIFEVTNESTIVATQLRDPALGVMAAGVGAIGQALEGVLQLKKQAHGVYPRSQPCSVSKPHPEHSRMVSRKLVHCPGIAEPD
jgi:hypothetical protein